MFRFHQFRAQSRQSAKLFPQSSELGPPHPLTRRRVCTPPPLVPGGGHTRLRERGWGSPNFDEGDRHCGTLVYMYFVIFRGCINAVNLSRYRCCVTVALSGVGLFDSICLKLFSQAILFFTSFSL